MFRTRPFSQPASLPTGQEYTSFNVIFLGVSCVIGTGVYFSSVTSVSMSGSAAVPALLASGLLCVSIALPFAELSTRISGFTYEYIYCTSGEFLALFYSLTTLVTNVFVSAINARIWGSTLNNILGLHLDYLKLVPIVGVSTVIILGRKASALFSNVATIINLCNAFIAGILLWTQESFRFPWEKFRSGTGDVEKIKLAFPVWFFTFLGFENIGVFARGIRNPGKVIPVSMIGSVLMAIILNLFMYIGVLGQNGDTNVSSIIDMVEYKDIRRLMQLASVFGITSSFFWMTILQGETIRNLSDDGLIPNTLSTQNSKGVPYLAVILHTLFAIVCCCLGSIAELIATLSWVIVGMPIACLGLLFVRYADDVRCPGQVDKLKGFGVVFALSFIALGCADGFPPLWLVNSWYVRILVAIIAMSVYIKLCKESFITAEPAIVECFGFPYVPIFASMVFFFVVGYTMNVKSFLFTLLATVIIYFTYSRRNSKLYLQYASQAL
eukprot:TRINITY_DN6198_c0_g1_i3.p1 TRINITY_DN6198_c0_g1~~TRINITY_DN6198_c0_g1_i3.p1  ORF type:complete len:496 (+),score=62.69 TRINITY_DN6198_c0_g1_i3:129-1616(+)